ncbi:MAG TPA: hypothetical protein VGQ24_15380, partial [Gemmatimonadales bacterium]|nr:hypothetical protein [Gemmatimonadales bacterium]
ALLTPFSKSTMICLGDYHHFPPLRGLDVIELTASMQIRLREISQTSHSCSSLADGCFGVLARLAFGYGTY